MSRLIAPLLLFSLSLACLETNLPDAKPVPPPPDSPGGMATAEAGAGGADGIDGMGGQAGIPGTGGITSDSSSVGDLEVKNSALVTRTSSGALSMGSGDSVYMSRNLVDCGGTPYGLVLTLNQRPLNCAWVECGALETVSTFQRSYVDNFTTIITANCFQVRNNAINPISLTRQLVNGQPTSTFYNVNTVNCDVYYYPPGYSLQLNPVFIGRYVATPANWQYYAPAVGQDDLWGIYLTQTPGYEQNNWCQSVYWNPHSGMIR